MRRGEVWWADLPAPAGRRPVVLLSRNEAYAVGSWSLLHLSRLVFDRFQLRFPWVSRKDCPSAV